MWSLPSKIPHLNKHSSTFISWHCNYSFSSLLLEGKGFTQACHTIQPEQETTSTFKLGKIKESLIKGPCTKGGGHSVGNHQLLLPPCPERQRKVTKKGTVAWRATVRGAVAFKERPQPTWRGGRGEVGGINTPKSFPSLQSADRIPAAQT